MMAEANSAKNRISMKCTATTNQQMISTEFTWIIRNFDLCPEQQGEYITSPNFCSDQLTDVVWCLRLYPAGIDHWGYVALMLQLTSSGKQEYIYASCKFAVIDTHARENFIHEEKFQKFTRESLVGSRKFFMKIPAIKHEEAEDVRKIISKPEIFGKQSQMLYKNDLVIRCEVSFMGRSGLHISTPSPSTDGEISAHLSSLLESGSLSDFTISVGVVKYPVHKAVLAARSSFFLAMLEADRNGAMAEVEDVSSETVFEMLRYIYTGKVEHLEEKAEELLKLAQKYRLNGLKALCEKALGRILTLENAVHLLILADDHLALELKNNVIQLIGIYAKEVCHTEEWKSVACKRPHLVEEFLEALVEVGFQKRMSLLECGQSSEH